MARVSRVGDGWTAPERIDWYADVASWLAAEAGVNYGSIIEGIAKGDIGNNIASTTTTNPPHGWWLRADDSVYWLPDGTRDNTCPSGNRIYISTPNGRLGGVKFTASNNFNSAFRFNSTAINCILEDFLVEHTGTNPQAGAECIRMSTSTNVADRPIIRRGRVNQVNGQQPSVRQSTNGGHALMQSVVVFNPNNNYASGFTGTGTFEIYDCVGIGAANGSGWASNTTLFTTSSQDNSGTASLRGITQAALVNYAANDVRTAAGGALDVAGTNQAFIGIALGGGVSNTISINELSAAYKVFQRPKTGSTLAVTVSGSTTGDPSGGLQWRLVDASTGTAISGYDWATLIASPAAGAYSQSVSVPVNTSLVKYKIQVRFTAATGINAELVNPFSVGLVYVQYGQSNGLRRVTRSTDTLTPNAFAGYYNGSAWAAFTNGDGAITTVNNLIATLGIPVGYQNYSVDSQSIAELTSGTHWNALVNGTTAATGGDFELMGIDQGERDGQLGTSSATYQSTHQTLLNNIMTHTGRDASQLAMIVNYGGNSNGYAGGYTSATIEAVRAGKAAFVAANSNAIWGGHRLDLPLSDNIHNTAGGYATASAREVQCYLHYKGLVAQPANGKTISSVNVSGSDVVVSYSGLSTDLTKTGSGASTITQISTDDFSSTLTITATVVTASSVTHTLSATPVGTVKVRDWWGADIPTTTYQGLVFPSSATAASIPVGSGQSAIAFVSSGNGVKRAEGSGQSAIAFVSSGNGVKRAEGSGQSAIAFVSSGNGIKRAIGSGQSVIAFASSGSGVKRATGSGQSAIAFASSGNGQNSSVVTGSGQSAIAFASSGSGTKRAVGSGQSAVAFISSGSGTKRAAGSGQSAVAFISSGGSSANPAADVVIYSSTIKYTVYTDTVRQEVYT